MASKKDKYLESAQRFMLKGQLDRAIKDYQQVVALEPNEIRYRQKLAELLVRDSRKEEAIAQYADIGKHYAENSYFLKAIAVYKQIQRLSPRNMDVAVTLASLNHKQGLIGNALAEYGQVVAHYEKEGALKDAVKILEQMLVIDGDQAGTRLKHAELLHTIGNHDASYEAFSSLLKWLQGRGDDAAARQVADRIAQLYPGRQDEESPAAAGISVAGGRTKAAGAAKPVEAFAGIEASADWGSFEETLDSAPDAFAPENNEPAPFAPAAEAPSAFAAPPPSVGDLAASNFGSPAAAGLSSPWEEEIELDLDDDPPTVVAAVPDTELPADFLLSVDQDPAAGAPSHSEPPSPFAEEESFESSPFAAAPSPFAGEEAPHGEVVSPFGELSSPFAEATASFQGTPSPFSEAAAPFADGPSPFSADPSPFGGSDVPFAEGGFDDLPPFEELTLEETPPAHAEVPSPVAEASPLAVPSLDDFAPLSLAAEESAAPLDLELPEEFPDIEWSDEADVDESDVVEPDVLEPVQEIVHPEELVEGAEEFEPLDFEPFEDFEPLEEVEAVEELEGDEEPEAAAELKAAVAGAESRKLRDWGEVFPDFVGASDAAIDLDDLESHYDLGVGYKEMGMYNQAIKEFAVAAANPQRRLDCLTLQAVCYREKGELDKAQDLLQRGREVEVLSDGERMAVSYELAYLLETAGSVDQAIELYREVYQLNPSFHDVGNRLSALTGEEPLDIIDLDLEEA